MSLSNARDAIGAGIAEALLNVARDSHGIEISYTHQKEAPVIIDALIVSQDSIMKFYPQVRQYDEHTTAIQIPIQANMTFNPSTGDEVVWDGWKWHVQALGLSDVFAYYQAVLLTRKSVLRVGTIG